jgi:uncharacterized protein YkwD
MVASLTSRLGESAGKAPRLLVVCATLALVPLLSLTSTATADARACRFAHTPIVRARRGQLQRAVVCLVNQQRRRRGLPGLRPNRKLNRSAQGWTNAMVVHREFTHGADFALRISAAGFNWSNVGENIATGYRTPSAVVNAWMASPGHCENILDPEFREVGTGVSAARIPGFSSRPGTWTQDFGLLMNQRPGSGNWGPADSCLHR